MNTVYVEFLAPRTCEHGWTMHQNVYEFQSKRILECDLFILHTCVGINDIF